MPRTFILALPACLAVSLMASANSAIEMPAAFSGGVTEQVLQRSRDPLEIDQAVRLALIQHPAAQKLLLGMGTTPRALLATGWLERNALPVWDELLGQDVRLDDQRQHLAEALIAQVQHTRHTWIAAAAARQLTPQYLARMATLDAQAELARSRREAQTLSRFDEAKALADVAEDRQSRRDEQIEADQSLLGLRQALGLPIDAALQLAPLTDPQPVAASLTQLADAARRQRISVRRVLEAWQAERGAPAQRSIRQTTPSLPLFDGKNPPVQAESRLEVRLDATEALHNLDAELARQRYLLGRAYERWHRLQHEVLPLRITATAEALKHYNGMLKGVDVLIDARAREVATRIDEIKARRDYWLARLELETSVGGQLPEGNESLTQALPPLPPARTPAVERRSHMGH